MRDAWFERAVQRWLDELERRARRAVAELAGVPPPPRRRLGARKAAGPRLALAAPSPTRTPASPLVSEISPAPVTVARVDAFELAPPAAVVRRSPPPFCLADDLRDEALGLYGPKWWS